MADETDDPTRGLDNAEAGPEEAEVKVSTCEEPAHMMEQRTHESSVSFLEEIGEPYQAETITVAMGEDGLPIPMDTDSLATAPPFTYENVVCIEDARVYVELFADEAKGGGRRYFSNGLPRPRREWQADQVCFEFGNAFVVDETGWFTKQIPVRPIRPACKYYKRQIFVNDDAPNPDEPGHKIIFRNCAVRRSIGGAALALRDEAVLACEWRDPPDFPSVSKHLDSFDNAKLASNAHKIKLPLFGGGRG